MSDLLNQASLVVIPSGYKEDTVYSVVPSDGSGDLSFTRASNGTRVNSAGLVEVCPWNLVEQSETFDNAGWIKNASVSITANATTAPNGTTTADYVTFSTSGVNTQLYQVITAQAIITQSLYIKYISGTGAGIRLSNGSSINYGLNLEFTNSGATLTGTAGTNVISYEIVNSGNNWFRVSLTYSFTNPEFNLYRYTGTGSDVYAIYGAQLNIGSTAKPYFPTTDRLNVPRLTYQNGGGGCPSLLLEKQSTNVALYSEQFSNAVWTQYQGGTITANSIISPDGTQNADTLTVASGQSFSGVYQTISGSSDVYTISIFAKYNTKRWLFLFDASASGQGWFDLQNGVLGTIPSGYTGTIENFGNGWFRCIFKKNTAVTPAFFQIGLVDADGFSAPTSNGSSYIYGAQLEASSYPTSYIPTTSASATRVADACSKTGISSLIGQTEGVMFAEINVPSLASAGTYTSWQLNDGSTSNLIDFTYYSTGRIQAIAFIGGSLQVNIDLTSFGLTAGNHKIAFAYKLNDYVLYVDGLQVGSDTSAQVPAMSKCDLFTGLNQTTVYKQFVLFPTRLTNAELASLTTI